MGKGYKVVVCGMASVGKTAILEQLLYGKHTVGLEEAATMEDVYLASVETDRGVKEQLRLYDTRGLQEGVELPKHYFSVADGFILVYAVTSLEAFQRVELLKKEIDVFRDKKESLTIGKIQLEHAVNAYEDYSFFQGLRRGEKTFFQTAWAAIEKKGSLRPHRNRTNISSWKETEDIPELV
ncbi:NF-kappa-B inhibitor-interacting Ras-like protein 1 isoform X2 [Rissa tridactyla]|uniref:NF-kappa-B inhibitor-interacting Ras-like protein 1 isoform X2 n=1 Tax=Rissa tridactyla TaxID=75485 RepID=UPI0023BA8250|nr:NF-kappa-B inhibitor-interacting Ras-like protein 1 isoform X2 [Rissa tridactyla]